MTHNTRVIQNAGGNHMATMREHFDNFMRRHVVDFDPCEVPELSKESITEADRKEMSKVLVRHENKQAMLSATKGNMSFFHHGNTEALKSLKKTF